MQHETHTASSETGIALLACTHCPWIMHAFEKALPSWTVQNSAGAPTDLLAEEFPELSMQRTLPRTHPQMLSGIFLIQKVCRPNTSLGI